MTIDDIKAAIEAKKTEIRAKESELDNFEIDVSEDEYNAILDSEGPVYVAGMSFDPSDIIKNCDPTAYRCGMGDYVDSLEKSDIEDYQALESELEDLESELEDLESELEEAEENEE